ncbi:hypothetical protein D0Z07_5568 [Hyphodiscus hymeniophilus]|uniref:Phosphatidylglycerol lysyltransferase C-terminal domain-containing protein n=1 Tax=Hyphodiscus hymeniophilus TaxID=353542 RepID=A0A9P6VIQ8_9HELO|nr:hypothetical protein D0Z07_5568 [Hyphodiscus hymeniophilus]
MSIPEYPSSSSESFSVDPEKKSLREKRLKVNKKVRSSPKPKWTPETFSQKLGHSLADGLIKEAPISGDSLDLVERLAFAKMSTTKTVTSTMTMTTSTITRKEETVVVSLGLGESTESLVSVTSHSPRSKLPRLIFDLNDFAAMSALEELIEKYGRVSHMGILDGSYTFFITEDRKAALYYKVKDRIAVVGGDPLCELSLFPQVLSEFEKYRKKHSWGFAFLGAGETFVEYAKEQKWTTMCFGVERVLNPMTNPVLHGNAGKSITRMSKNLLDLKKGGITLEVYTPRNGKNIELQQQLVKVYEEWRNRRNGSGRPTAYITVYDPFALPEIMTYIYSKDRAGVPNGFAALRTLGANKGYHLDPYVATPGAPKGITDLLLYGTMALLDTARVSYLSLGYEPLDDLGEITGIPKAVAKISRKVHRRIFQGLRVAGKKGFHDKFRPDENQQSNLYLVFPPGIPSLRHMTSIVHIANIRLREVAFSKGSVRRAVEDLKESKEYVVGQSDSGSGTTSSDNSARPNSTDHGAISE